jgi:hypothetical protein
VLPLFLCQMSHPGHFQGQFNYILLNISPYVKVSKAYDKVCLLLCKLYDKGYILIVAAGWMQRLLLSPQWNFFSLQCSHSAHHPLLAFLDTCLDNIRLYYDPAGLMLVRSCSFRALCSARCNISDCVSSCAMVLRTSRSCSMWSFIPSLCPSSISAPPIASAPQL